MKLLVITAHFPPTKSPEADHAFYLCENLVKRGFQVDVLTSQGSICASSEGIKIHPIMRDWSWNDLPRLVQFLRGCAPDTVLLMYIGWIYDDHPMMTYAATITKRLLGNIPFVTQIENAYGADPSKTSLLARAVRKCIGRWAGSRHVDWSFGTLLRDSDRIIVLSDRHRARLSEHYPPASGKCVLIPPPPLIPIDCHSGLARQAGRELLRIDTDEILVAYFGYMYPGKGVETLLQAFQRINPAAQRVRLVLIGGSLVSDSRLSIRLTPLAYLQTLYNMAKNLGIDDTVIWVGGYETGSYTTSRYLHAADICVLPFEKGVYLNNSSFAAAAAHGLPIITTRGTMVEAPFRHTENVFLCRPKDPDELAASMQTVIGDLALRKSLSCGARELAQEWFSWEKAIERTVQALRG